jgi:inner membrane protein
MCSVVTHPVVPVALAAMLPHEALSPAVLLVGAACAVLPDVDVLGFQCGVGDHPLLGHRGVTHSIVFATVLAALLTSAFSPQRPTDLGMVGAFFFVSTLSHALLDMLTNGGRGVALWAPFSATRYFFPWRPIEVAPLSLRRFFSGRGVQVLRSELRWVWLPAIGLWLLGMLVRRYG